MHVRGWGTQDTAEMGEHPVMVLREEGEHMLAPLRGEISFHACDKGMCEVCVATGIQDDSNFRLE